MAPRVGWLEAIEPSRAALAARRLLAEHGNARVTQATIDGMPFADATFDLAICLGVLHHVPRTESALRSLAQKIKPGGHLLIYLYYALDGRSWPFRGLFRCVDMLRRVVCRLPPGPKHAICDVIAYLVYLPLVLLGRALNAVPGCARAARALPLSYYQGKSLWVMRNDALDRFGTPLEKRFTAGQVVAMLERAGFKDIVVSPEPPFWHAAAVKRSQEASEPALAPAAAKLRVLTLVPYGCDTVPGQRFRVEQWARELKDRAEFLFVPFESPRLKGIIYESGRPGAKAAEMTRCLLRRAGQVARLARSHDVILLYRELAPIGPPLLERALGTLGVPIVYDFDDAIFVPSVSAANRAFQWLKFPGKTDDICRLSTAITVGNPYLKRYADRFCERVVIIPTTIDTEAYRPRRSNAFAGVPVIGWSGSLTTAAYLKGTAPMLQELRRRVPFRLSVVGAPEFSIPGIEVSCKKWESATETADIAAFDIGLMPLPDDPWAQGKCGLKTLQYMALGVPSVSSAVGVNSDIVQDGTNGFLATTDSQWIEKLEILLRDESKRRAFALEGRRTVVERYSAKVQAPRFLAVLEEAAAGRSKAGGRIETGQISVKGIP